MLKSAAQSAKVRQFQELRRATLTLGVKARSIVFKQSLHPRKYRVGAEKEATRQLLHPLPVFAVFTMVKGQTPGRLTRGARCRDTKSLNPARERT